jgi:hypothetical protein
MRSLAARASMVVIVLCKPMGLSNVGSRMSLDFHDITAASSLFF